MNKLYYLETDLHKLIKRGNVLRSVHMKYITYQILKAIKYIHSADVIHRDLKVVLRSFQHHAFSHPTSSSTLTVTQKYVILALRVPWHDLTHQMAKMVSLIWIIQSWPNMWQPDGTGHPKFCSLLLTTPKASTCGQSAAFWRKFLLARPYSPARLRWTSWKRFYPLVPSLVVKVSFCLPLSSRTFLLTTQVKCFINFFCYW